MMPRYGERVRPGCRYRNRPGAYAVVLDGGDVLVTEQAEPRREVLLPGGGIDPGEAAVRALHRECLEETGWRIRVERRLGAYQRFAYMPDYAMWARKVCAIYLARPARRLGAPSDPDHRALWMPIETAVEQVAVSGDRVFLEAVARALTRRRRRPPGGRETVGLR